ncbi:hypothetical protein [Geobacter sp. DSM 9736]|uniref:hypothetical protein n=1 Tax=Geobacter sp. DSM 9736 TaxID=1277350 RepID=UPI000B50CD21|nr:hypothetical protein [Geobacter sp. DSM 9736]SNB47920.1 hypothetical protein SAMN06269301_3414 [Geobacter sp. DSM 9736]
MKRLLMVCILVAAFAGQATAGDIRFTSAFTSGEFRELSKELGAALSFKNNLPPHPLGVTGFDIGAEVSVADIKEESSHWSRTTAPSVIVLPKLRARKGLPFGIDIGGMYSNAGNTDIELYGVELTKAIIEGGPATPALGLRAAYTKLTGLSDLDLQTVGVDASIGKGFLFITPYVGAGMLWIDTEAKGELQRLSGSLSEEIWQPRFFGGVEIKPLPLLRVIGEVEYAVRPVYSLKAAIGF